METQLQDKNISSAALILSGGLIIPIGWFIGYSVEGTCPPFSHGLECALVQLTFGIIGFFSIVALCLIGYGFYMLGKS